ncbi:MAG: GNAT family protein [Pelolinea sp.]|nr:GNAT family protein [Pelolinea sp.]
MIIGKRVRLRAIEKDDLPRFVAWLNDPEVRRNLLLYQPLSMGQEEQWYADILKENVDEQPLCVDVEVGENWEPAGNISLIELNQHDRSAEIGIFIGRKDFWNKGYGCEAMRLMIGHGFNDLNLNRIFLRVYETNPNGVRCYEKAGFKHEGRLREAHYHEGRYIDMLMMSILKSEWIETEKTGGCA